MENSNMNTLYDLDQSIISDIMVNRNLDSKQRERLVDLLTNAKFMKEDLENNHEEIIQIEALISKNNFNDEFNHLNAVTSAYNDQEKSLIIDIVKTEIENRLHCDLDTDYYGTPKNIYWTKDLHETSTMRYHLKGTINSNGLRFLIEKLIDIDTSLVNDTYGDVQKKLELIKTGLDEVITTKRMIKDMNQKEQFNEWNKGIFEK